MANITGTQGDLLPAQAGAGAEKSSEALREQGQTPLHRIWTFLSGPYPTLVSRLALGLIFIVSGLTKLGVPETFATSINSYEMPLPGWAVQAMATWLPPIEMAVGIFLIIGLWLRFSGAVTGLLMVVFIVAMVQAMFRGLNPNCGCFAAGQASNPWGEALMNWLGPVGQLLNNERVGFLTLFRDLVFLLMSAHVMFVRSIWSVDNFRFSYGARGDEYEADYDPQEYAETAEEAAAETEGR
jgi:uncharacterized membrane protein YphA (DoxX/SURF4 family)